MLANMKEKAEGKLKELRKAESNAAQNFDEATVASREEDLKVIGVAKKILQETSSGAVSQSNDFLQLHSQLRTRTDLIKSELLTAVKGLARRSHSAALAQPTSKM